MVDFLVGILSSLPRELATIILAAVPITESQLAIPLSIARWDLSPAQALGFSLIGNSLPFLPLYFGLEALRRFVAAHLPWLTRFIDFQVERAHRKLKDSYERYGALALFLFIAIPLPFTGVYTATVAAVALKIPVRYAALGILTGMTNAAVIVTLITMGVIKVNGG